MITETDSKPETPRKNVRVPRIKSLTDITREMLKIYAEGRKAEIPLPDMSRYINALQVVSGTISKERELNIESRLAALEETTHA